MSKDRRETISLNYNWVNVCKLRKASKNITDFNKLTMEHEFSSIWTLWTLQADPSIFIILLNSAISLFDTPN